MKTMGFASLRIVDSEAHLQPAARWWQHGAGEILDGVQTFATLEQGAGGCRLHGRHHRPQPRALITVPPPELLEQLSERSSGSARPRWCSAAKIPA